MQEIYAKYIQAKPADKKQAAQLTSSNSIVGNNFMFKLSRKENNLYIYNKFNYAVAKVSNKDKSEIVLQINKKYIVKCLLAYVTYCQPKDCHYATFLVIAYPKKNSSEYNNFTDLIKNQLENGFRPKVSIGKFEHNKIIENKGNFKFKEQHPKKIESGTVICKGKVGLIEQLIESARNKKIGCYIGSIFFLLAVAALIV